MKKLLTVLIALIGLSLIAIDADARRMGGGRSIGKQREMVNPQHTQRAPAQQQQQAAPNNAPAQQQAAPAAGAAQQASGMSRWLGPLAGLALGAGLAALFLNNGLAGVLAGLLLIAAIVIGVMFLVRMLRARSAHQPLQYAGATPYGRPSQPQSAVPPVTLGGHAAARSVAATTRSPADFSEAEFVRHAKLNFVNLQAAHDRKDLSAMRDFLTPELYGEIEADIRGSGDAPQQTEVVTLNAEVLDVAEESDRYAVSVRFSGLVREEPGAEPQPFSEIWHLEKPVRGRSGWMVSGIQQA